MLPEERDHRSSRSSRRRTTYLVQVLAVVVVPPIDDRPAHTEEAHGAPRGRGRCSTPCVTTNRGKTWYPSLVASSPRTVRLPYETDREASFSVYKTDHPATELDQPFLLVFRTRHVVTLDIRSDGSSSAGYTGFSSIWPDAHRIITGAGGNEFAWTAAHCLIQACHLRTVIVTAAVYRGLDSKLRPKANLSS